MVAMMQGRSPGHSLGRTTGHSLARGLRTTGSLGSLATSLARAVFRGLLPAYLTMAGQLKLSFNILPSIYKMLKSYQGVLYTLFQLSALQTGRTKSAG